MKRTIDVLRHKAFIGAALCVSSDRKKCAPKRRSIRKKKERKKERKRRRENRNSKLYEDLSFEIQLYILFHCSSRNDTLNGCFTSAGIERPDHMSVWLTGVVQKHLSSEPWAPQMETNKSSCRVHVISCQVISPLQNAKATSLHPIFCLFLCLM